MPAGLSPLIAGQAFTLESREMEGGTELYVTNAVGTRTMEACAEWH